MCRQRAAVFLAAQLFDLIENRTKNIGLVIRNRSGKIREIFRALDNCGGALETHSGVDVSLRQRREGPVRIRVELDEDEIPNLDAARIARVHERAWVSPSGVRSTCSSEHGPHGPVSPIIQKLSFLLPLTNVHRGIELRLREKARPMIVRFLIEFARLTRSRLVNGRVEPLRRKFPALDD